MSWDVFFIKFERNYSTIEDIEDDAQPLPMGSRAEIQAKITELFPETDWNDPSWGVWDAGDGVIEFSISKEKAVDSFALFVRAASASVVGKIVELALKNGWQAMDTGSGGFLEKQENPVEGYAHWEAYKNQVVNSTEGS